jgi:hypothetical protein
LDSLKIQYKVHTCDNTEALGGVEAAAAIG